MKRNSFSFILRPSAFGLSIRRMFTYLMLLVLVLVAALCALCGVVAVWSRRKKSGARALKVTGRVGSVVEALRPEGAVLVDGELWRARARAGHCVERGRVRVVGARGHLLEVEADG
jgi:membrane-bound ClpP family serine protease